jgi:hypothetical protein
MITKAKKEMWCQGHEGIINTGEEYTITRYGEFLCAACAAQRVEKSVDGRKHSEGRMVAKG